MTSSEASQAQTYPSFTLSSRSISLSTQQVGWGGMPLVVSLLPFVPSVLFLFFSLPFLFSSYLPPFFFFPHLLLDSDVEFYQFFPHCFILLTAIRLCKLLANLIVQPLYIGVAATKVEGQTVRIGISIHDGVYSVYSCIHQVTPRPGLFIEDTIRADVNKTLRDYSVQHRAKFVGAGVTPGLENICPGICPSLWRDFDTIAMVLNVQTSAISELKDTRATTVDVDEQADSAAQECVMHFGPNNNPALTIAFRNQVMPDAQGAVKLVEGLGEYRATVHKGTWNTVLKYAFELKGYTDGHTNGNPQCPPTKIAFFSATPQGGGVALMRHALVRFGDKLGVKLNWFVFIPSIVRSTYLLICETGIFLSPIRGLLELQRQITTSSKEWQVLKKDLTTRSRFYLRTGSGRMLSAIGSHPAVLLLLAERTSLSLMTLKCLRSFR